jgi:quercetin dioxygenase-like cupin family protein
MTHDRLFHSADHFQPNADEEPIRSVVTSTAEAVIVAWHVAPGQRIASHVHPQGQDTWTVLSGRGDYVVGGDQPPLPIGPGDVLVAPVGAVHGVYNGGTEPLRFISVVSPGEAGYERL